MIPILILAAGQSRRMRGADKLMQDVHGQPLLRKQIICASPIGPVFVALPNKNHPRHTALIGTTATDLNIPHSIEGIGGTLREAVSQLPPGPFMLLLADLIKLKTSDLQCVVDAMHEHKSHVIWRGATSDGKPGHPIIFADTLRKEFANLRGDVGGENLVKPLRSQTYLHRFHDDRARFDLDTPEDWEAWRSLKT
tara:strand:+ start:8036 stop:8620 length:585 start_codon:yes stop_codon:yes gene_type:complete